MSTLPANAAPADVVADVLRQWTAAFAMRGVDALAQLYAPDCFQYGGQPGLAVGREGVRGYFSTLPTASLRVEFGTQSTLRLAPTVVTSAGLATFFVGGVATPLYHFTFTFIHADGAWKIASHHASIAQV
jgi:uncharacterized protein (TIGR02246 family)